MIYLCSPYSHPDTREMEYKYRQVAQAAAHLIALGEIVYSPIVHCHHLACNFTMPREWEFWRRFDLAMLDKADECWVLELDGWHKSVGVNAEIAFAIERDIPVCFLALEEVGLRG